MSPSWGVQAKTGPTPAAENPPNRATPPGIRLVRGIGKALTGRIWSTDDPFKLVESIGRRLPGVEVTTAWGTPALKVNGHMFVCLASNKDAEPETLVVMMDFADRDALVDEDPETYYLKEHYVGYPCVLVRLTRVHPDALHDLVTGAHRYISAKKRRPSPRRPRSRS